MKTLYLCYEEKSSNHPIMPNAVVIYLADGEYQRERYIAHSLLSRFKTGVPARKILNDMEALIKQRLSLRSDISDLFKGNDLDTEEPFKNIPRCFGYTRLSDEQKRQIKDIFYDYSEFLQKE